MSPLMLLFILTAVLGRFDLGIFNSIAALGIAAAKAILVLLFFMHLRYNHWLTWVFASAGVVWLGILFVLTMSDYGTRGISPLIFGR